MKTLKRRRGRICFTECKNHLNKSKVTKTNKSIKKEIIANPTIKRWKWTQFYLKKNEFF